MQGEAVVCSARGGDAALDQQRVAAVHRQRDDLLVLARRVHRRRGEHHPIERIEQAPVHIAPRATGHIEKETVSGAAGEAIDPRLVRGIQGLRLPDAIGKLRALVEIQQAKTVGTGRVLIAIDAQQVLPCLQLQHGIRVEIDRIGLAQRTRGNHRPARPAQRPVDLAGVAQRVEDHPSGIIEREAVAIGLTGDVERAVHARDDEGRQRV